MLKKQPLPPIVLLSKIPGMQAVYPYLYVSAPMWMLGLFVLPLMPVALLAVVVNPVNVLLALVHQHIVLGPGPLLGGFSGDPLNWRSFESSVTSHHTLILWAMSGLFLALWKGAKVNPVFAAMMVLMVLSVHELFWWQFDFLITSQVFGQTVHWYWLFGYLLEPALGCFLFFPQITKYFPYSLVLSVFFFDFIWALAGWPVTVNYVGLYSTGPLAGITQWYGTDWGNGWEFASWAVPMICVYLFERKNILSSQSYILQCLNKLTR